MQSKSYNVKHNTTAQDSFGDKVKDMPEKSTDPIWGSSSKSSQQATNTSTPTQSNRSLGGAAGASPQTQHGVWTSMSGINGLPIPALTDKFVFDFYSPLLTSAQATHLRDSMVFVENINYLEGSLSYGLELSITAVELHALKLINGSVFNCSIKFVDSIGVVVGQINFEKCELSSIIMTPLSYAIQSSVIVVGTIDFNDFSVVP